MTVSLITSLPNAPVELYSAVPTLGKILISGQSMWSQDLYIPVGATKLIVKVLQHDCSIAICLDSVWSPKNAEVDGPMWGDEVSVDVASLRVDKSYSLIVCAYSSKSVVPFGDISGIISKWEIGG